MLPDNESTYNTRSSLRKTIKTFPTRTSTFQETFFSYCTKEWNQLNDDFKKIALIQKFKKTLIRFIRTKENSVFGVSDLYGIKVPTRLELNISHLNEHKFKHNLNDTINPMQKCGADIETNTHYLLRCQLYSFDKWSSLMTYIN